MTGANFTEQHATSQERTLMPAQGFVILTLVFRQDGRRWTGECLELGTATYGRTLNQTHDELADLVLLHLNTLEDVGERERFFRDHNIRSYTDDVPTSVRPDVPVEENTFVQAHQVPLPFFRDLVGAGA